jgi:GrpB-like predicted nucleotidyltransferase (UPF0157 family)
VVADSAQEDAYAPALEAAGYVLCIRELSWYEHWMFKGPDIDINPHMFSSGCPEIDRMRMFRDRLSGTAAHCDLHARGLIPEGVEYVQNYADAKTAVIEIIARVPTEHLRTKAQGVKHEQVSS